MAGQTAGLRIQRRRVEHIHQLMAEIADRQRIAAHLIGTTFRACYYFLTLACLTAGLVGLAEGRRYLVDTWGVAGVVLVVLWVGVKAGERVASRVALALGKELARGLPGKAADAAPGVEPGVEPAVGSLREPAVPPAVTRTAGSGATPRRLRHHRIPPLS